MDGKKDDIGDVAASAKRMAEEWMKARETTLEKAVYFLREWSDTIPEVRGATRMLLTFRRIPHLHRKDAGLGGEDAFPIVSRETALEALSGDINWFDIDPVRVPLETARILSFMIEIGYDVSGLTPEDVLAAAPLSDDFAAMHSASLVIEGWPGAETWMLKGLSKAVAARLKRCLTPHMLPEEVKTIRKKVGMTQSEFASATGVSARTVFRWENGIAKIDAKSADLIHAIEISGKEI